MYCTFQPDDEGYGELDLLAGSDDAIGYHGTVHYSTKYVHQYRLHLDNKEISNTKESVSLSQP